MKQQREEGGGGNGGREGGGRAGGGEKMWCLQIRMSREQRADAVSYVFVGDWRERERERERGFIDCL